MPVVTSDRVAETLKYPPANLKANGSGNPDYRWFQHSTRRLPSIREGTFDLLLCLFRCKALRLSRWRPSLQFPAPAGGSTGGSVSVSNNTLMFVNHCRPYGHYGALARRGDTRQRIEMGSCDGRRDRRLSRSPELLPSRDSVPPGPHSLALICKTQNLWHEGLTRHSEPCNRPSSIPNPMPPLAHR